MNVLKKSLIVLSILLCLTACGKKGKNDEEIISDFKNQNIYLFGDITNIEIIERKTSGKTDHMIISVDLETSVYTCNQQYELEYKLVNDNWELDNFAYYNYENWKYEPISAPRDNEVLSSVEIVTGHSYDCEIQSRNIDLDNLKAEYIVKASKNFTYRDAMSGESKKGIVDHEIVYNETYNFEYNGPLAGWHSDEKEISNKYIWNLEDEYVTKGLWNGHNGAKLKVDDLGNNNFNFTFWDEYGNLVFENYLMKLDNPYTDSPKKAFAEYKITFNLNSGFEGKSNVEISISVPGVYIRTTDVTMATRDSFWGYMTPVSE